MQIIISATELRSSTAFQAKLAALFATIPGVKKAAKAMASKKALSAEEIQARLDPTQITVQKNGDGDVVVWINPEAVDAAGTVVLSQYAALIEIAVAAYPVVRLAVSMFNGVGQKFEEFGKRFRRKPDPRLGDVFHCRGNVMRGGDDGEPAVNWYDGRVVAVGSNGDLLVEKVVGDTPMREYCVMTQDGRYLYSGSTLEKFATAKEAAKNLFVLDKGVTFWRGLKSE